MLQLIHKQWNISEIKEIKHDEYIFWELAYTYLVRLQYIIGDGICHYSVPMPLIFRPKIYKNGVGTYFVSCGLLYPLGVQA